MCMIPYQISLVAEGAWMVLLQLNLLKIQHYTRRNPRLKPLSGVEICFLAAICWISYLALVAGIGGVVDIVAHARSRRIERSGGHHGLAFLFYKTLWSWVLHRIVMFCLKNAVPVWNALQMDSMALWDNIRVRGREISEFIRDVNWRHPLETGLVFEQTKDRKSCQSISLERHKSSDPTKGARILSWKIAIEKEVLDEMKEALGPPGGFGEMGFNITKEGVCFEAMGIRTRFSLDFALKVKGSPSGTNSPKKK